MKNKTIFKYVIECEISKLETHFNLGEYNIILRANGFEGEATEYCISSAFQHAFENLTGKLLEGTAAER